MGPHIQDKAPRARVLRAPWADSWPIERLSGGSNDEKEHHLGLRRQNLDPDARARLRYANYTFYVTFNVRSTLKFLGKATFNVRSINRILTLSFSKSFNVERGIP